MSVRGRVTAVCNRCEKEGEHYTRKDGSKVSPCVACSKALAAERAAKHVDDPNAVVARREAYRRYNASAKGKARLARRKRRKT